MSVGSEGTFSKPTSFVTSSTLSITTVLIR